jgi:2-iminobutanoate/2-iminopropanoate deaminase
MHMKLERINPDTVGEPMSSYSQATRVESGDTAWIYVSGQMALDRDGRLVGPNDMGAQTEQVFENVRAILEANGAEFRHVVKIQTFMTRLDDLAASREVRARYLASDPPTSTTVRVAGLILDEALIEIDVVAVVSTNDA